MSPRTLDAIKADMIRHGDRWYIPLMDFVDDFRRSPDHADLFDAPLTLDHPRYDALLASTIDSLAAEQQIESPDWCWDVPACPQPWFVSGIEDLKAMALVQSPVYYRRRMIFVLENFPSRV